MCNSNKKIECEHPERRPADSKCSEELIQKCHGSTKDHPCNCKSGKK
ncbi:hypothetical protein CLNEO_28360 [Anaerotignum neopropionicum]|uniref:Uncharacterized protein n=1 Tax=Anaerotignum neopropionicum TaxID=36847 RepID=A0A136WBR3_9FIRM|nr:hypothetical protein CLNEO_28360 [Anaerotignum neopropionicum]